MISRETRALRAIGRQAQQCRSIVCVLAACLVFLTGCGGSGSSSASNKTFNVSVTGSTASVTDLQASKGDTITLTFTTDADEEVHLHGYDIHFDCKKGVPLTKTFSAANTGQFEYELEATSKHLGNLVVNP